MTAGELIEELKKHDPWLHVHIKAYASDHTSFQYIHKIDLDSYSSGSGTIYGNPDEKFVYLSED